MNYRFLFLVLVLLVLGCKSKRPQVATTVKEEKERVGKEYTTRKDANSKIEKQEKKPHTPTEKKTVKKPTLRDKVVHTAQEYTGTPYYYGGNSNRGLDCSGLIYIAYTQHNVQVPRTSRSLHNKAKKVSLKKVKKGDLLFFATSRKRRINHVALVTKEKPLTFIHATSSRGVVQSTFSEAYWKKHFISAGTILN